MSYFLELQNLLEIERKEDLSLFENQNKLLSNAEKRNLGIVWYPIAIRNTEIGRGDYLLVEVERTTHQEIVHQFRSGVPVAFFTHHDSDLKLEGLISHVSANRMRIALKVDELPDWMNKGKIGVQLLFDNNSYDEMKRALKKAEIIERNDTENRLIKVLTGVEKPFFKKEASGYISSRLNDSQNQAVNSILAAQELAILHGPPGTGKTTTLVEAISALYMQSGKQILVTAPSNTAVDLLTLKLAEKGVNVIRIGNPIRVSQKLEELTLDYKINQHQYNKEIKQLKKQAAEYRNMAHKYKRSFGKLEREQRKALFDEAHKLLKQVEQTESFISEDLLNKAQVITATLVGVNNYAIKDRDYDIVVIDEAAQALEPACWIPVLRSRKVIFAGDHLQLPPTVKSKEAEKLGLSSTLLEKNMGFHPEAVSLLTTQYRMNKEINDYPSIELYESKLHADRSVATRKLDQKDIPVEFVDTAGCSFDEKINGTSVYNPEEANFTLKHLTGLLQNHNKAKYSVAVISPYKQQVELLKELIEDWEDLKPFLAQIDINTIDSFQGQERDIVYISLTRSNSENAIGFLSDIRRMNVAITRARMKLVVIGDSGTLSKNAFYSDFISYTEKINGYKSAWEFMHI
ncbi:AAA ATPase [Pseudopedobacter saltans DSM 12145]|uniref:AAA ATPase n=1 Tax=Pseudopedobacter saltans (strain ATCC 51119 / DSM 12145 / JCM 21818 / CCUG 39354 / LMG 10337 / NBRC 100064 / NCIMB 13643) TaxID=762903 RepID=F0SEP5_PSESL|nr:AAA domain-containing protein [Pseudopedobacter saltans]ADY51935.1 AAA ATPase [Pseudopedobacter saltans DSM 12145]